MVSARRLSLVVASALVGVLCVNLLGTHQKLARVHFLEAGSEVEDGLQKGDERWVTRKQQAHHGASSDSALTAPSMVHSKLASPAVIAFAYNRPKYLNETLHSLSNLTGLHDYTVYVSQDGNDEGVRQLVEELSRTLFAPEAGRARRFVHWMRPRVPELGAKQPGSAWLAQHYKYGLDRVFMENGHSHVVIIEDDMLFSPDFLSYFEATAPLLDADPTLWCVSTWNDNGLTTLHDWDPARLFRTSYFPGLGWMMKRELWLELGPLWPKDHWDHWMRMESTSRGRECIAPEVSRNRNIGEVGANMDKASFRRFLAKMDWSTAERVDLGDLSYLLQPAYSNAMRAALASATRWVYSPAAKLDFEANKTYFVTYTIEEYQRLATRLKLWPYPRGHHQFVASLPFKGARILLADRRFCPLLPPELQLKPTPGMRAVAGERGQSCLAACEQHGLQCIASDFWFINMCSDLKQHFPCERGCTVELGTDVPNYVMDPNSPGYRYCLITQRASQCSAANKGTARLCPCAPASPGSDTSRGTGSGSGGGQAGIAASRPRGNVGAVPNRNAARVAELLAAGQESLGRRGDARVTFSSKGLGHPEAGSGSSSGVQLAAGAQPSRAGAAGGTAEANAGGDGGITAGGGLFGTAAGNIASGGDRTLASLGALAGPQTPGLAAAAGSAGTGSGGGAEEDSEGGVVKPLAATGSVENAALFGSGGAAVQVGSEGDGGGSGGGIAPLFGGPTGTGETGRTLQLI